MCGILGGVNREFGLGELEIIERRGPDGWGISHFTAGGHQVGFGHRRLAILDLSPAGAQPMTSLCGRYSLTFNGEVYNHLELRKGLPGLSFNGHSDTETMLHHLALRGIHGIRDFNGIFAFGFLDRGQQKLYLVRDPFGIKPLYYAHQGNSLIFCSEIKPILALMEDCLDPAVLAELLHLRYVPAPNTLFRQIKKVRPGHVVEVDLSRDTLALTEYPYITPPEPSAIPFADAVERYGDLFQQAVRRQLLSDVEVGILLSGGVDSALVAAYAAKEVPYRIKAFTVGYCDKDAVDETVSARETAELLGLEYLETRIGFHDFLDRVRECTTIVEEPLATTSMIPMHALTKLASQQVKVVLSGQGADEALGGYGRYRGEQLRRLWPGAPFGAMLFLAQRLGYNNEQVLRGLKTLGKSDDIERFNSAYRVFGQEQIESLIGVKESLATERLRYYYDLLRCADRRTGVERMMSLDLRMNLSDDLLLYTDKITMHHSLECRVPMLDLELVRFVESLPASYRVGLRRGKIIHKKFSARALPDRIISRKKLGFEAPTNRWFKNGGVLREIFAGAGSKFASYFDLQAVHQIIAEHEAGYNRERQLFLLLSICYWISEFA